MTSLPCSVDGTESIFHSLVSISFTQIPLTTAAARAFSFDRPRAITLRDCLNWCPFLLGGLITTDASAMTRLSTLEVKQFCSVDIDTLEKFSILVDYYKCHEITEFFAHLWVDNLRCKLPTSYGRHSTIWLFVSFLFSNPDIFAKMTELAMKESQGPLDTMCLPLPPTLLGKKPRWYAKKVLTWDIASIERKRTDSLHRILRMLDELREGLVKGRKGCIYECSSILLGTLIKEMDKKKFRHDQLLDSLSNKSIDQVKSTVLGFKTPVWYPDRYHNRYADRYSAPHHCSLSSMLQPGIEDVWRNLNGLRLDEYQALSEAEYQSMRSHGYSGESSFLRLLRARAQLRHRGSIRCHVCMMYEWSEACYLHDMTMCTLRKESRLANALLAEWEGLAGADGGEREQCDSCRFPISVCRLGHGYNDDWTSCDGMKCEGVTVLKRVVAALMTVADGSIGDLVVEEEEKVSYATYEKFSREWLEEQIETRGGKMPRIANMFHRLLDGFEVLCQAGWGRKGISRQVGGG